MGRDETPKQPAPRPDHSSSELPSTSFITREAHCYGGYEWTVKKSEVSQSGLPHSIGAIR